MRYHHCAIPFTLLLTVGPLISAAPTHAARGASAEAVTLKLSDMPSGFTQLYARSLSLKAFAKDYGVSVPQATGKGFIGGYETMFSTRATRGIVWVADQAYAFQSSGGARWAYRVALPTTGKLRRVSSGRVGDRNSAYLFALTSSGVSILTYVMVFRRGAYFALVSAGAVGKFKTSRILHYAKVMDGRMQTAKKPSPTPTSTPTSAPTNVPTPAPTGAAVHFIQVSAGGFHACGLKTDHGVACWGSNFSGQASPPSGSFVQVSAGGVGVTFGGHTCGVKTDSSVACWGENLYGGARPPSGSFLQVGVGDDHTCGVKTDHSVACWGDNSKGEARPPSGSFLQVTAGDQYTCGVRTEGSLACWGNNDQGQASPPSG